MSSQHGDSGESKRGGCSPTPYFGVFLCCVRVRVSVCLSVLDPPLADPRRRRLGGPQRGRVLLRHEEARRAHPRVQVLFFCFPPLRQII
jgi:hypothetical protein